MLEPKITKLITVNNELIVSVDDCGRWLNMSPAAIIAQADILESLIITATDVIESYSWLSLRQKTFEAYYECLYNDTLLLNRSPVMSIGDIEYLYNDNWVLLDKGVMTIDGLYENVTEKTERINYASIYLRNSINIEDRKNAYKIRVTYDSGYDINAVDEALKIPEKIKTAIKMIVAFYFVNRGDCESDCNLGGFKVPCAAKSIIDQFSISNIEIGGCHGLC